MNRWIKQFNLEARFIFSQPAWLCFLVGYGAWMGYIFYQNMGWQTWQSQNIYSHLYDFYSFSHTFSLGAFILLGILLMRKDVMKSSYEWIGALPVPGWIYITAKFTAGILYASLFPVLMSVIYTCIAWSFGYPSDLLLRELSFFGLQCELSYMICLSIGMALAVIIRNRSVYLAGSIIWIFSTFFLDTIVISRFGLYPLRAFHLSQFLIDSFLEDDAWGLWLSLEEFRNSRIFILSLVILLLGFCVYKMHLLHTSRYKIISLIVVAVLGAGSILAYYPYGKFWAEKYAIQHRKAEGSKLNAESGKVYDKKPPFEVKSYELDLDISSGKSLKAKAGLIIKPEELPDQAISFTLNPSFHVKQISIEGTQIPFSQTGSLVEIDRSLFDFSKESQKLEWVYEGSYFDASYSRHGYEHIFGFIQEPYLLLNEEVAWYPLPGYLPLVATMDYDQYYPTLEELKITDSYYNRFFAFPRTDMDIRVKGFANSIYSTIPLTSEENGVRHFKGDNIPGASLLAGELINITNASHTATVVTTPGNKQGAEGLLSQLNEIRKQYAAWLDESKMTFPEHIFYIKGKHAGFPELGLFTSISVRGNSLVIGETRSFSLDKVSNYPEEYMLFGDINSNIYSSKESFALVRCIREVILRWNELEHDALDNEYGNLKVMLDNKEVESEKKLVLSQILQALQEGKLNQVKRALAACHKQGLSLPSMYELAHQSNSFQTLTLEQWNTIWEESKQSE